MRRPGLSRLLTLACSLVVISAVPVAAEPAAGVCASDHLRVRLDAFDVPTDHQSFYMRTESQSPGVFRVKNISNDCSGNLIQVSYGTTDVSATAGQDYEPRSGQTPPLNDEAHPDDVYGAPNYVDVSVPVLGDTIEESVVESVLVALSAPIGGQLADPSRAPLYIIDDDAPSNRLGLDAYPYQQNESHASVQIPVFRSGPAAGASIVSYSFTATGSNPASPTADFTGTPGQLTFGPGERYQLIPFTIVDDREPESPETLQIGISGPGVVGGQETATFTITDNEEGDPPSSRLDHPRQKRPYARTDHRIRDVHVFVSDSGGSGVVAAQLAIRRRMKTGGCQWLSQGGWQSQACPNRVWLPMTADAPADVFHRTARPLKPSMGTRIANYTAFSRAIDRAGNVEKNFTQGRNANTFEVKRSRRR